jgi:hypothetical protein
MEGSNKVSQESLQKALETLGLASAPAAVVEPVIEKAEPVVVVTPVAEAPKSEVNVEELVKGFESKILALGTVIQHKDEETSELKKAMESVVAFNKVLAEKIGLIEKQPLDRKSVGASTAVVERFEKGGNVAEPKVYNIANPRERKEVGDILMTEFEKGGGKDQELAKAIKFIDISELGANHIEARRLHSKIMKEFNIDITRRSK